MSIVLTSSGALAVSVIVYLLRSQLAYNGRYVGILMALGAIACGVFLIRRLIRVLEDKDKLQEEQPNANQVTVSLQRSNPVRQDQGDSARSGGTGFDLRLGTIRRR